MSSDIIQTSSFERLENGKIVQIIINPRKSHYSYKYEIAVGTVIRNKFIFDIPRETPSFIGNPRPVLFQGHIYRDNIKQVNKVLIEIQRMEKQ